MRGFLALTGAVLVAIAIGVATLGATGADDAHASLANTASLTSVPVPPSGPCPSSLRVLDVRAGGQDLKDDLLLKGAIFGSACRYAEQPGSPDYKLLQSAHLNGPTVHKLETIIEPMNTKKPHGVFSCPAQFPQTVVLAFGFASKASLDLWYSNSGCQTLDNGYLEAFQVENPGAFSKLFSLVATLVRPATP